MEYDDKAVPGYTVRCSVVREGPGWQRVEVSCPAAMRDLAFAAAGAVPQEVFLVAAVDARNVLVGWWEAFRGSLSASLVHPREVFGPALALRAAAVVVAHTHPSGDPAPSREDDRITERLRAAGETLGVPLLDHVVVGTCLPTPEMWSYRERGLLVASALSGMNGASL